ncbi:hypothetical protein DFQ30_002861 [Apophysomyces sp. BC1015]|nr:hypothetical protein DFQ30_002861 [Apophysomyces sp. BC1015]
MDNNIIYAVSPSSLIAGAAWIAKAFIVNIEKALGLTPENTRAIWEFLFNLSFSQKKILIQGLIESFLSKSYPTNDRENVFENVMDIFSKHSTGNQEIISAFTNSLTQTFYVRNDGHVKVKRDTKNFSNSQNDIQKPFLHVLGNQFRSADGSGNSVLLPNTGKAGTRYVRTVSPQRPVYSRLPDPHDIFDRLLKRPDNDFTPHKNGVNALLFYLATIITHDLFNSDPEDLTKNKTTGYADLSPLYGSNAYEQNEVRVGEDGLLKPDQWADNRLTLQPAGVGALLVLFSRNHNYIAQNLLKNDENGQFSRHKDLRERDELLFQTARLVNNRW